MSRDSRDVSRTWDQLVDSELRDRRALKTIDDPRRPRDKSPVLVKLVWEGEDPLEPGHVVKLGSVVFDPESEVSAPFSGLQFHCSEFDAMDTAKGYAIALDSISNVGYGIIPEAAWVKLNVLDIGHTFAKIITGGTLFDTAADGLPILWKQSGTGEKWAVVLLVPTSTSTTQVPLRRFQLTADKTLAFPTATAKFMAFDNSLVGLDTMLHDPAQIFAGKNGFRGYAIQRTDLGAVDPDRWEIILMERYAEFIVVEKYDPTTYHFVSTLSSEDDWWRIVPATVGSPITITDPAAILGSIPTEQKVIARLSDPDTPTYDAMSTFVSAGGRRVRGTVVDPGSGFVSYAAATFEIDDLTEVYGGPPPAGPITVQQTFEQGYVAGQLTEAIFNEDSGLWENLPMPIKLGCHLDVNSNGFIQVLASSLAGTGLTTESGPGGCLRLAATGGGGSLTAGCGITISSGVISVDVTDLAGDGLDANTGGGNCKLEINLCEAIEAKAVADDKTSGTYLLGVVDGVCTLLEVTATCSTPP